ncbi:N-acetylmuramoyl-L-alanine amidase [uncultured Roseobacter sp.]|uniref:N-acetylmuramoyl-L-alanine amidase n=1 Tax=uncultured Roseobacter sp. TaxID=114847 RepID=UPI00261E7961|nr:N-acetylmuramoyl-L-alanine amidase [uncultured Roseobacter sp.]
MHQHPSPNSGPRKNGLTPEIIVIHYTAMQSAGAALQRLCDPVAEVSAHYLIDRQGRVTQMVPEEQRAWHAGQGEWHGQDDINSRSVGIELDNTGAHPFPEPQMAALERLIRAIMHRWDIPPQNVIGHSDMAPGRKQDPGPRFDWARLAMQGLAQPAAVTAHPAAPTADRFRARAKKAGFSAPVDDETLLRAVRLRFRPWATGPLAPEDLSVLG